MKHLLFFLIIILVGISSCDKVKNPYPANAVSSSLDWSLYPGGDSATYVANGLWPSFTANSNMQRNVLIEDFTGHQCVNCPYQTDLMEQYIASNPEHIFGLAIHAGPSGMGGFQETSASYPEELFCEAGLSIGKMFGEDIPGSTFLGNPAFNVNRLQANSQYTSNAGATMTNKGAATLSSTLRVNIQAVTNYFSSTRGLFAHVEVDKIDASLTAPLGLVICIVEDSLVGPQTVPANATWDTDGTVDGRNTQYVHRDIFRGMLDNRVLGRELTSGDLGSNNKYYLNYSYRLPDEFEVENMKLYIYVMDKNTLEIYQVIEHHLQ